MHKINIITDNLCHLITMATGPTETVCQNAVSALTVCIPTTIPHILIIDIRKHHVRVHDHDHDKKIMGDIKDYEKDYDALVVGGGIMGVCIARDLAESGYQVAIVERESSLGGVWIHNDYPDLRLQGVSAAWRCLSLAPAFHHNHDRASPYCPLARETLTYIESMADHPNITTFTNTLYEGLDKGAKSDEEKRHIAKLCSSNPEIQRNSTSSGKSWVVPARTVILAVGYDTHRSGKPWLPIERTAVTNGAQILHSAELSGASAKLPKKDGLVRMHSATAHHWKGSQSLPCHHV